LAIIKQALNDCKHFWIKSKIKGCDGEDCLHRDDESIVHFEKLFTIFSHVEDQVVGFKEYPFSASIMVACI